MPPGPVPRTPPLPGSGRGGGARLVLVRQAKAVPKDRAEDFERSLNRRGRAAAPETGRWLAQSGCLPRLVLCSPSRRTRETWELIAPALPGPPPVVYDDRLYDAGPELLGAVLAEHAAGLSALMLVGHKSGIQGLASALCGSGPRPLLDRLRSGLATSGVLIVDLPDGWDGLTAVGPAAGAGRLTACWSPPR
ncbi:SixA phosphatase family protein [Streptomyces sp. cmx-4-9]|uniref:SixA phosphatase family protein n=1 Tax=Streptomyces sp. cmx-4-9 TaxID=2790941 RepID=UPI00397F9809